MATATVSIPVFYQIWFDWADPAGIALGVYTSFFDPNTVLNLMVPEARRGPDHDQIYFQLGSFTLAFLGMQVALMRYTKDLGVWKVVQASLLATDVALLYTFHLGLKRKSTLSPALWRSEDWGFLAITDTVTNIRIAFLRGIGLGVSMTGSRTP